MSTLFDTGSHIERGTSRTYQGVGSFVTATASAMLLNCRVLGMALRLPTIHCSCPFTRCRPFLYSEFVVSIMSDWFVESANHSCGNFSPEVDEMAVSGLTPAPSTLVTPPRVKESAVNMECKVLSFSGMG